MEDNTIKAVLPHGIKIKVTFTDTGENTIVIVIGGKIQLLRGRIYHIPVTTSEELNDHYIVKTISKLRSIIDIKDITNGVAIIIPIVHGTILRDNDELCVLV